MHILLVWSAGSNLALSVIFLRYGSDSSFCQSPPIPHSNGVATLNDVYYPDDNVAYAYMAKVVSSAIEDKPQGIASNPVQLTFGKTTRLLLNVTRGPGFHAGKFYICGFSRGISIDSWLTPG